MNNTPDITSDVPHDIIEAVKKIEEYTSNRTTRNDWAIGNITCRKGAQKLLERYNKLVLKLNKLEQIIRE